MKDHKRPVPPVQPRDQSEVERYLREQPPIEIPRRSFEARQPPGIIAHRLLGNRVITRYEA